MERESDTIYLLNEKRFKVLAPDENEQRQFSEHDALTLAPRSRWRRNELDDPEHRPTWTSGWVRRGTGGGVSVSIDHVKQACQNHSQLLLKYTWQDKSPADLGRHLASPHCSGTWCETPLGTTAGLLPTTCYHLPSHGYGTSHRGMSPTHPQGQMGWGTDEICYSKNSSTHSPVSPGESLVAWRGSRVSSMIPILETDKQRFQESVTHSASSYSE